jgi:hypothetical protein
LEKKKYVEGKQEEHFFSKGEEGVPCFFFEGEEGVPCSLH